MDRQEAMKLQYVMVWLNSIIASEPFAAKNDMEAMAVAKKFNSGVGGSYVLIRIEDVEEEVCVSTVVVA